MKFVFGETVTPFACLYKLLTARKGFLGLIAVVAPVVFALDPDPNAPIGAGELFLNPSCLGTGTLTLALSVSVEDLVANQCYEAAEDDELLTEGFLSFEGYPFSDLDNYECSFEAYFETGCIGPKVVNQLADDGYNLCYRTILSPIAPLAFQATGRSYKWACVNTDC